MFLVTKNKSVPKIELTLKEHVGSGCTQNRLLVEMFPVGDLTFAKYLITGRDSTI